MPVEIYSGGCGGEGPNRTTSRHHEASFSDPERAGEAITIGLINNMPDAAFKATERQYRSLLGEASGEDIKVRLLFYVFPEIPRKAWSANDARRYASAETLLDTRLDGLIVTGREPTTPDLRQECYWERLTEVMDWAKENTSSAVWSCLAAHAAVLHLDGIGRRRNVTKHSGVMECERVSKHRLNSNIPSRFHIPHSRYNGVAEEELGASGYRVLARAAGAGVDSFVKDFKSLFVFLQGHPEYESDTLLREFRRDVERYLRHESDTYPAIPRAYFDWATEAKLTELGEQAWLSRDEQLMAGFDMVLSGKTIEKTWRQPGVTMYRNWIEYLGARKHVSPHASQPILVDAGHSMSRGLNR
jgi:homoserine O-succinyltransferase